MATFQCSPEHYPKDLLPLLEKLNTSYLNFEDMTGLDRAISMNLSHEYQVLDLNSPNRAESIQKALD